MVLASTILAIALGLTPVEDGQTVQIDSSAFAKEIGRYSETTDRRGVRHLRGFDRYGRPYEVTIDQSGRVEAAIGENILEFTVAEAS